MRIPLNMLRRVCMISLMAISTSYAADGFRTWSDSKGKNKIKAKFVKLENDAVTLENEDGEEIEIELKKLSAADQKFAADAAKESDDNPFKSKSDDPFKPKSKTKKKPAEMDEAEEGPSRARTVSVDLNTADKILIENTEEWKVDVEPVESKPPGKLKPIQIPSKANFFDGLKGLAFNHGEKKAAVVGFLWDKQNEGTSRVAICDLTTGKCNPPSTAAGKMVPIALHDDGRQIVMKREEFGFGNQDRLEIWTQKGAKVSKTVSWVPFEADKGAERDVMWAEFIDAGRLATSGRGGKVVVWKYPEIEPLFYFETDNGALPALSPDRKLIAYSNGKEVGVIDVEKQEVIAQQSTPTKLQWPYMAFSPSGKKLACVAFDKVLVWDLATGELQRTIPCTGLNVHGSIEFTDDNFVLAGNHYLIDLENQLKLWTYNGGDQVRSANGVAWFAITDGENKPGALVPLQLPHPQARDLLKKALSDPTLFVLRAGTAVRIDVNSIPDVAQRERVATALKKQLEAIGCKAGSSGTIDVVASVEGPKDTKLSFRNSGDYNFKEYLTRVKFVYQTQTAWETVASNGPGFVVHLKPGENMEGHLRQLEKPNYDFFDRVQLPKFLQKPTAGQGAGNSLTIGKSQVTTAGLR